jgi:signal transduction histidine kinase
MIVRRLRYLAIAEPIVIVLIFEGLRSITIVSISQRDRLILDGLIIAAFIILGVVMIRAIRRTKQTLERQNAELLALHGAGLDVTAELSLDAVLNKVVERARILVGARYGALSVVNDDASIQTFLTSGVTSEQRARIGPPPAGHGLLGVVLHEGERLRLPDIGDDPRSHGFPRNHPVMRSLLAVPVTCKGPFVGNLYLSEKQDGGEFTPGDEETLERFAVQAAIAIDNAHLHRQVSDFAVAQERLRIAHEMHDGIAQVLGYVNTKVQAAKEYIRQNKTEEGMEQLRELAAAAREAYSDVRESIVDLRTLSGPPRSLHLVLEEYVAHWKMQAGVTVDLLLDDDITVPPGMELQVVRIIQESLANVRKHAKAAKASLEVRKRGGKLSITVSDDGVGLPDAPRKTDFPRFGISTMRERAESIGGTFSIQSNPGGGTVVHAGIPLPGN